MSIRVADITGLQAIKTSGFSPDIVRTAYVTAIPDFFKFSAGVTLTPVANVIVNSADGLGQWTRMGIASNRRLLIADTTFSGATTYTSPTWAAGTYRRLELTLTVTTPPGSGNLNITLTGRGGTYSIVNLAGGAASTWAIASSGTSTVFGKFTIEVVTGRPLAMTGQVTDTASGYTAVVSGINTTTTGNATNLVITGAANWAGSIYLEGIL